MAVKENKQSSPKVAKTSDEQDALRRTKKAKQRKSGGRQPSVGDLFTDLAHDRMHARTVARADDMLSILEVTMTSTGESSDTVLKAATAVYIAEFSLNTAPMSWWQRHNNAVAKALRECSGSVSLMRYTRVQLDGAFRRTRPVV